jgi:hypothetical protein
VCRIHAELTSGRVTYSTVELHCGISEGGGDVIFTNYVWRNVIDFDTSPYEEVILTIKEYLPTIPRHKNK